MTESSRANFCLICLRIGFFWCVGFFYFTCLAWDYDNDFGGVPDRDDVRFDVAYGDARNAAMFGGVSRQSNREGVRMQEGSAVAVLRDVAPAQPDTYRLRIPLQSTAEQVRIQIQPKRFCFEEPDRRVHAFAPPRTVTVEVASKCTVK